MPTSKTLFKKIKINICIISVLFHSIISTGFYFNEKFSKIVHPNAYDDVRTYSVQIFVLS